MHNELRKKRRERVDEQKPTGGIVHDQDEYSQIANPMTDAVGESDPSPEDFDSDIPVDSDPDEAPSVDGRPEEFSGPNKPTLVETPAEQPVSLFSWQASEFIHHQKTILWYVIFFLVAALFIGAAAFLQQWFTVAVFVVMTIALAVYAHKPPRVLHYDLSNKGITIDGKLFTYGQFRDFAVIQDVAWHSIDLEPTQRFMPRLTILFDNADFDHIVEILTSQLPRVNRTPDMVERFTRMVKF